MSNVLVPIVEGDGEVEAVPVLLRRILAIRQRSQFTIARPKNAHGCGNLNKPGGLEKFVELAFREQGCAGVLILMDADERENCPFIMARGFTERIRAHGARHPVATVFAKCEFEAWFLASLSSMAGYMLGSMAPTPASFTFSCDVESIRDAKGRLSRLFPGSRIYKETEDQAPMAHRINFSEAMARSRSFNRLCHAMDELIKAVDSNQSLVSPA